MLPIHQVINRNVWHISSLCKQFKQTAHCRKCSCLTQRQLKISDKYQYSNKLTVSTVFFCTPQDTPEHVNNDNTLRHAWGNLPPSSAILCSTASCTEVNVQTLYIMCDDVQKKLTYGDLMDDSRMTVKYQWKAAECDGNRCWDSHGQCDRIDGSGIDWIVHVTGAPLVLYLTSTWVIRSRPCN